MGSVPEPRRVVIAGGGVAAVEAALALRALARDRAVLTIVAPSADFVYRPFAVLRPFETRPTYRIDLARIANDVDAELVEATAVGIDAGRGLLELEEHEPLPYDALLIAIGASAEPTLAGGTITPWDWGEGHAYRALLESLRTGRIRNLAFVVPGGIVWPVPLYELALLTSAYVLESAIEGVSISVVTVEQAPLEVFGAETSGRVAALLGERGIAVLLNSETTSVDGGVVRTSHGVAIPSDATVAVPVIRARRFSGVPTDAHGFIVTDDYCRVETNGLVFAAGDCADHPVKQGGVAAQQADAAAAAIAAAFGAEVAPAPVRPHLGGVLFTGETSIQLGDAPDGGDGPHVAPAKIEAPYLQPYLRSTEPPLPTIAG